MNERTEENSFCPTSQQDWRNWLEKNHFEKDFVWLIFYKKSTKKPSLTWSEAVDEALCFGWIDGIKKTIDEERYQQYFCKRKAKSTWSKVNKEKIDSLIENGKMKEAGLKSIEIAKENGSWSMLDAIDAMEIPIELERMFDTNKVAESFFESLNKSKKKALLYWIISAKREETKLNRIKSVIENATNNELPKQFRS